MFLVWSFQKRYHVNGTSNTRRDCLHEVIGEAEHTRTVMLKVFQATFTNWSGAVSAVSRLERMLAYYSIFRWGFADRLPSSPSGFVFGSRTPRDRYLRLSAGYPRLRRCLPS